MFQPFVLGGVKDRSEVPSADLCMLVSTSKKCDNSESLSFDILPIKTSMGLVYIYLHEGLLFLYGRFSCR